MTPTLQEYFETGLTFQAYKCPAMPMGICTGLVALQALGIGKADNEENSVFIRCSGRDS